MTDGLLPYYERELRFIRELIGDYSERYPARARLLGLQHPQDPDPHVERLIEAFALLTGRVQRRLDDDFPELTDALLSVLYPHYLAPIPSLGVVQLEPDPLADLAKGPRVERGSTLTTGPVEYEDVTTVGGGKRELSASFRTCYPVALWPVAVTEASLEHEPFPDDVMAARRQARPARRAGGGRPDEAARAILRLRLTCLGGATFAGLGDLDSPAPAQDRLRFHLDGDPSALVAPLYELLFTAVTAVLIRPAGPGPAPLLMRPEDCLLPVGFEDDEGLLVAPAPARPGEAAPAGPADDEDWLPYPRQSFSGYRLLTEFFAFPRKFFFFDLAGLSDLCEAGFGRQAEVIFFLRRPATALVSGVKAHTFRLGCTPVVNLFEKTAAPDTLSHASHEYRVVPDHAHEGGMEVYSVDRVAEIDSVTQARRRYRPFFSYRHGGPAPRDEPFWYASRRPSLGGPDAGNDVFIGLVDLDFKPWSRRAPLLQVQTTCTNRNLARNLLREGDRVKLELEWVAAVARIRWVGKLALPIRPPRGAGAYWRLLSHLNLNHLSLAEQGQGCEALKEVLRLYGFADGSSELVDGLLSARAERVVERVAGAPETGFARGLEMTLEFDRARCAGVGAYLFASVLERFLGLYTSINSFSKLVARVRNEKEELKRWPPRAGKRQLL